MKFATLALVLLAGCSGPTWSVDHTRSAFVAPGAADGGQAADDPRPPQPESLPVPSRVALAFVSERGAGGAMSMSVSSSWSQGPLPEAFKSEVLEGLADAFRGHDLIGEIQVVPSFYMSGLSATQLVASVRATFDVDVVVLVTYDLQHFWRMNGWATTYILLLPIFFAPGNEVESHLFLDAAAYWSQNGALLFRAAGNASYDECFAPPYWDQNIQETTTQAFSAAREALVPKLRAELERFAARIKAAPPR